MFEQRKHAFIFIVVVHFNTLQDCTFNELSPKNCQTLWNFLVHNKLSEAAIPRRSAEYVLLKVSQNLQENTCAGVPLFKSYSRTGVFM